MLAKARRESETEPVFVRVPITLLKEIDEFRERNFYKTRQEVLIEGARRLVKEAEAQA